MKIIKLNAENIKKLVAVEIAPERVDEALVEIVRRARRQTAAQHPERRPRPDAEQLPREA